VSAILCSGRSSYLNYISSAVAHITLYISLGPRVGRWAVSKWASI